MGNLEQAKDSKRDEQAVPLPAVPWLKITYTKDDTDLIKAMKFIDILNRNFGTTLVALAYETVTKVNDLQLKNLEANKMATSEAPKQGSAGISKEGEDLR